MSFKCKNCEKYPPPHKKGDGALNMQVTMVTSIIQKIYIYVL